jgi:hypothetical protein
MLTIEYAKNPVWNNDTGNAILLNVKFAEFNEEMPFTATNYDNMSYGVNLYNRAKAGEFGAIGAYVAPNTPTPNQPVTQGVKQA